MVGPTNRQTSIFHAAFGREAELIKDDLLDPIDKMLDDPALVDLVRKARAARSPHAGDRGRRAMAPDRLLRCCTLKHLKNWSFRELERELRASLVYRRFTRYDADPIPRFNTLSDNFGVLGPEVIAQVHARVVAIARQERVAHGRKLRTDTTVVESNVHYPADSTLLQDGIRVLTRAAKRITQECLAGGVKVVDHARSVKRRCLEIHRAAKALTEANRERLKGSYQSLVGLAGSVVRKAERLSKELGDGELPIVGSVGRVLIEELNLRHFTPLVKKVIAQTQARVFGGDNHVAGKVLSIFEEHTQAIRKGKAHKPTEFGRLVRIDEVENGIVSGYAVQDGNPADVDAWEPALDNHEKLFERPPKTATGDRGFFSAENERKAKARGVKQVVLPARGVLSKMRATLQKQRWFRRALRWRGGIEPRIATLKHRFGMARAYYKKDRGFKRFVAWSVISQNLVSIARVKWRREAKRRADASKKRT